MRKDLVGQKFGRLIVVSRQNNDRCGCLRLESTKRRFTKHGYYKNRTYQSWDHMIQRCTNPRNRQYKDYGGRKIIVCKQWLKFANFLKDMGKRPDRCSIDRVDNNKGYYKKNCRWVDTVTNNRNKRNNHLITHKGKTQCLTVWASDTNINYQVIQHRLKRGWSIEKTLTNPVRKIKKRR